MAASAIEKLDNEEAFEAQGSQGNKMIPVMICAQLIFGTTAIFTKLAGLPASFICMSRGCLGFIFLLFLYAVIGVKIDFSAIQKNLVLLIITGASLAMHWILVYESYAYTRVATSSLCFYTAPIFVILAGPFVVGEKMTVKKMLCVLAALLGLSFLSGFWQAGGSVGKELPGILLSLSGAMLYAMEIFLCKKLKGISSYDVTIVNMLMVFFVSAVNVAFRVDVSAIQFSWLSVVILFILGAMNTATAYVLYFKAFRGMQAHSVAMMSYISPVTTVFLSALVLRESLDVYDLLGGILILGACFVNEMKR